MTSPRSIASRRAPAGRGQQPRPSPVQSLAEAHGLPCPHAGRASRDPAEQRHFADLTLDAAVVVAYGLILPPAILEAPRLGCLNIHASLLPRWRGAAPIQRAILAGDRESGITIMQMDEGLDTGPMLLAEPSPIAPRTHRRHACMTGWPDLGARLIVVALEPCPPAAAPAAAAGRRRDLCRQAHARGRPARLAAAGRGAGAPGARLRPCPGRLVRDGRAHQGSGGRAVRGPPCAAPGTVLDDRLTIACGEGALRLLTVQRPGKAPLGAAEFLRGFKPGIRQPVLP